MIPNATVSYMAARVERQLVETKAARAWIVDAAAIDRTPGSWLIRLSRRPRAMSAVRIDGRRGTVKTTRSIPRSALGVVDPAR